MTLALDANVRDSALTHSRYVALKGKDAIVDRLRDHYGRRPDVDPAAPDLPVNLHLAATAARSASTWPAQGCTAAAIAWSAPSPRCAKPWPPACCCSAAGTARHPFVDPMCGSGTLPIEAALLATRTAPGLARSFAFQKWPGFDARDWQALRDEAHQLRRPAVAPIVGADRDPRALRAALDNAGAADQRRRDHLDAGQTSQRSPARPGRARCLFNPPYGERLKDDGANWTLSTGAIGDTLKQRWTGWTAWLLTGNLAAAKCVGLKATRRIPLWNGPLECRLLKYELY